MPRGTAHTHTLSFSLSPFSSRLPLSFCPRLTHPPTNQPTTDPGSERIPARTGCARRRPLPSTPPVPSGAAAPPEQQSRRARSVAQAAGDARLEQTAVAALGQHGLRGPPRDGAARRAAAARGH